MGKTIGIIIAVIALVAAAGAGGFYGGAQYQQGQQLAIRNAFYNSRGGGNGGTGSATSNGGNNSFGGGVSGTVKSINGNSIQVSTAQNVTTVTLSGSTTVMKTVAAAPTDLQVGQQITVRGQRDSSGNVAATSIQVLPAGANFGGTGGGNGGRANGSGASAAPAP